MAHITTLAGYVHYRLTGEHVLGIGEASGVFPIDSDTLDYDETMLQKLDEMLEPYGYDWRIRDLLPAVQVAGTPGGHADRCGRGVLGRTSARRNSALPAGGRCRTA